MILILFNLFMVYNYFQTNSSGKSLPHSEFCAACSYYLSNFVKSWCVFSFGLKFGSLVVASTMTCDRTLLCNMSNILLDQFVWLQIRCSELLQTYIPDFQYHFILTEI
jgi:hypothetical protein